MILEGFRTNRAETGKKMETSGCRCPEWYMTRGMSEMVFVEKQMTRGQMFGMVFIKGADNPGSR